MPSSLAWFQSSIACRRMLRRLKSDSEILNPPVDHTSFKLFSQCFVIYCNHLCSRVPRLFQVLYFEWGERPVDANRCRRHNKLLNTSDDRETDNDFPQKQKFSFRFRRPWREQKLISCWITGWKNAFSACIASVAVFYDLCSHEDERKRFLKVKSIWSWDWRVFQSSIKFVNNSVRQILIIQPFRLSSYRRQCSLHHPDSEHRLTRKS